MWIENAMLRRPLRRPVVGVALLWVPAVYVGLRWPVLPVGLGLLVLTLVMVPVVVFRRSGAAAGWGLLALPLAGLMHGALARPGQSALEVGGGMVRPREFIEVAGTITDDPVAVAPRSGVSSNLLWRFTLRVDSVCRDAAGWHTARAHLAVRAARPSDDRLLRHGDRLRLAGVLEARQPGADAHVFLCVRGGEQLPPRSPGRGMRGFCYDLRRRGRQALSLGMENRPVERAFLHGLIWGYRRDLPVDVMDAFRQTGTLHILAISGAHVAIMAGLGAMVLRGMGVPLAARGLLIAPFLILYVLATGGSPSAFRAAAMAVAFFLAPALGRKTDALSSLALAALLIVAVAPHQLTEPGFQLSFIAVLGLILLMPRIHAAWGRSAAGDPPSGPGPLLLGPRIRRAVSGLLSASTAAWLATTPLCAAWTNVISPASLAGNLVVIPAASVIMGLGCAATVAGSICPLIATGLNRLNAVLVHLLLEFIAWLAGVPFSHVYVRSPPAPVLLGLYVVLALVFFARGRLRRRVLAVVLAGVALAALHYGTDRRTSLDIAGPALAPMALVNGPRTRDVLMDPGSSWDAWQVGIALRRHGVDRLAVLWLTTPDAPRSGAALEVLQHFPVDELWYPSPPPPSSRFTVLLEEARRRGVSCRPLAAGDTATTASGLCVEAWGPPGGAPSAWRLTAGRLRCVVVGARADGAGIPSTCPPPDVLLIDTALAPDVARAVIRRVRPRLVMPRFHSGQQREFAEPSVQAAAENAGAVWLGPALHPEGVCLRPAPGAVPRIGRGGPMP